MEGLPLRTFANTSAASAFRSGRRLLSVKRGNKKAQAFPFGPPRLAPKYRLAEPTYNFHSKHERVFCRQLVLLNS